MPRRRNARRRNSVHSTLNRAYDQTVKAQGDVIRTRLALSESDPMQAPLRKAEAQLTRAIRALHRAADAADV